MATGPEHNKRLVRRALEEIYAKGDVEVADELIHPDFVDHEPAHPDEPTGPESVRQTVRQLHGAFGGLRFEVQDEIAEGDKVVQLVIMSGRHTGSLMGREPTGREFAVRHIYIWRIAGGQIVEHWGSRDDLGLLGQLGVLEMQSTTTSVALDLFAGICVSDYQAALPWYERLLGSEPAFFPHATEAVWELAAHRFLVIDEDTERAGHARQTIFVDDLDALVSGIAGRGIEPAERETYSNGVRKATYRDADGNEIGFGGAPA